MSIGEVQTSGGPLGALGQVVAKIPIGDLGSLSGGIRAYEEGLGSTSLFPLSSSKVQKPGGGKNYSDHFGWC